MATAKWAYERQEVLARAKNDLRHAGDLKAEAYRRGALATVDDLRDEKRAVENARAAVNEAHEVLGGEVFRVPTAHLDGLEATLAKLAKRAVKLGTVPPALDRFEVEAETRKFERAPGDPVEASMQVVEGRRFFAEREVEFTFVVLTGETPVLNGWQFVARLTHGEHGVLIFKTPRFRRADVDLGRYHEADWRHCDHCGFLRYRKDSYVVRHVDTGETKQVGRNCLADFTGFNADPTQYVKLAEYLETFLRDLGGYGDGDTELWANYGETTYSLDDFLAVTAAVIRRDGWTSRTAAWEYGGTATADIALNVLHELVRGWDVNLDITEADDRLASATIEWVRTDVEAQDDKGDYLHNLAVAFRYDGVTHKRAGIVASAVNAYTRERERALREAEAKKGPAANEHIGAVKERLKGLKVKVVNIEGGEGNYGFWTRIKFVTPEGNRLTWFASGIRDDFEVGEALEIDATVKRHDTWTPRNGNGETIFNETIVTRVAVK